MDCKNHVGVAAINRCAGCAEAFCNNCLVQVAGKSYCGSCKTMAVANAPMVEAATLPCKEANDALTYAIVGIFCFGIILEPMALYKANKAAKMIALNPRLTGSGKVKAAYIIASIALALWILGVIVRISQISGMHP